jgi:hypothetical protein
MENRQQGVLPAPLTLLPFKYEQLQSQVLMNFEQISVISLSELLNKVWGL